MLSNAQNLWESIPSPVSYPLQLTKVIFKDSLTGWASGDSGIVIHTTDGGASWEFQNTGIKNKIENLFFLDKLKGWALSWYSVDTSYGSYILNTTDGGSTWKRDSLIFKEQYLYNILFNDSLKGFVSSNNVPIYYTTNGGINWIKASVDTFSIYPGGGFTFFNENEGIAYGGILDVIGVLWRTTDGGLHWHGMNSGSWDPIRKIHFFDSLNVLAIGGDPEYGMIKFISSDGGNSWTFETLSKLAFPLNLSFRTSSEIWIPLGNIYPEFFVSKDSGNTWSSYSIPNDYYVNDVTFPDSLHGYAVGQDGIILKYHPLPVLITDYNSKNLNFELNQNYPNPFNSSTEITYTIKSKGLVDLTIYDLLGRKITVLVHGEQDKGEHRVTFNAFGLPSGVFYIRLTTDKYSSTKKAILLR